MTYTVTRAHEEYLYELWDAFGVTYKLFICEIDRNNGLAKMLVDGELFEIPRKNVVRFTYVTNIGPSVFFTMPYGRYFLEAQDSKDYSIPPVLTKLVYEQVFFGNTKAASGYRCNMSRIPLLMDNEVAMMMQL